MKKTSIVLLAFIMTLLMSACGDKEDDRKATTQSDGTLAVYTTVYPLQYFTERIGGELVNVNSIYPAGADEHSFDPTQKDMIELSDADLFFYIGLGLEGFVENAQKTLKNENVEMIATADSIPKEQLEEYCRRYLGSYKVPKEFYFVEELPRNASNKLLRRVLKEWAEKMKNNK